MKDVNLNIASGTEVVRILTGNTLPEKEPNKIFIKGDIHTVSNFLKIRKEKGIGFQNVDTSKAVVFVNKEGMSIKLLLDPENAYGGEVAALLELSDELKVFYINQSKTFTREELVKLIRFNKLAFDDSDKHAKLLTEYQKLEVSASINSKQASDTRGNKENNYNKAVSTNIPSEFILNIPIFKGFDSDRFRVEICLDVTDAGARFWFESVELHELIHTKTDIIFNEELKSCDGFVVINQ